MEENEGKTMDIMGKILALVKDFGVIALAVIIGIIFFNMRTETSQMLKDQAEYNRQQQENMYNLVDSLKNLAKAEQDFAAKSEQQKQVAQEVKVDLGRSIRNLNKNVKELKNVQDPKESYTLLANSWDWNPD